MRYHHLTQEERYQISALKDAGRSLRSIAVTLERTASTISRELRRNRIFQSYHAQTAILLTHARRQHSAPTRAECRKLPGPLPWKSCVKPGARSR